MTPEEFLEELGKRYNCVPPEDATEEDLASFEKDRKVLREK